MLFRGCSKSVKAEYRNGHQRGPYVARSKASPFKALILVGVAGALDERQAGGRTDVLRV